MTQSQRYAAVASIILIVVPGLYFAADLFDPGITSSPVFTRSYFESIGGALVAGLAAYVFTYWYERQKRVRNRA
jgi:hypothetical protein